MSVPSRIPGPVRTLVAVLGFALVLVTVNTATAPPEAAPAPAAVAAPAAVPAVPAVPEVAPAAAPEQAPAPAPEPPAPEPPAPEPAAPEPPAAVFPAKAKFVGEATTAKGPIPVALTVEGNKAKAYVCDGKKIEAWLQGTAENGTVTLTGRKGARLTGTLVGDAVEGTLRLDGYPEWEFTTTATKSTRAGLYRANDGGTTTGWIVRDEAGRDQVGIVRDASGAVRPAPLLDLAGPAPAAAVPGTPAPVGGDTDVLPGS